MRLFVLFMFMAHSLTSSGQLLSLTSWASRGHFFSIARFEGHDHTGFGWGNGFGVGVELTDVLLDSSINPKFGMAFERYGGYYEEYRGGMGGGDGIAGDFYKNTIKLELYPVNVRIVNNIRWSFGSELVYCLPLEGENTHDYWSIDRSNHSEPVRIPLLSYGLNTSLSYRFQAGKLVIEPGYLCHLNLTGEFDGFSALFFRHVIVFRVGMKCPGLFTRR